MDTKEQLKEAIRRRKFYPQGGPGQQKMAKLLQPSTEKFQAAKKAVEKSGEDYQEILKKEKEKKED